MTIGNITSALRSVPSLGVESEKNVGSIRPSVSFNMHKNVIHVYNSNSTIQAAARPPAKPSPVSLPGSFKGAWPLPPAQVFRTGSMPQIAEMIRLAHEGNS
jgi:hypothetical protein